MQKPTPIEEFDAAVREHAPEFGSAIDDSLAARLSHYYSLLMKWNARLHLVAPCPADEFATRHVLESLLLVRHVPAEAHVTDVGSGAGLPSIPCLLARPDIRATLIDSSQRKAVFLKEAVRALELTDRAEVIAARFQDIAAPPTDVVTCRALERFERVLPALIAWAPPESTLLLFGGNRLRTQLQGLRPQIEAELIPTSERRFLIIASPK